MAGLPDDRDIGWIGGTLRRANRARRPVQKDRRDFQTRMAHFCDALSMRDERVVTQLFGMGLGTYPKTYARRHTGARPLARVGDFSRQPIWLALHTARARADLSLDDIALKRNDGRNLVKNGDFSATNDYWFWSVDNHLPWHTMNMAVNVLFDQGWLGMVGVILIFGLGLIALARTIWAGYLNATDGHGQRQRQSA